MIRHLLSLALVLAATAALGATPAVATERTTPEGAPLPRLDWHDCDDGFQCATAELPRDYSRPHGAKVRLAVIRHPAVDQEHRIGSLFLNPGGPGGSGVGFVRFAPPPAFQLLSRFDWVGFDPRGVGQSEPAIDCEEGEAGPLMTPDTLDVPALLQGGRERARLCLNQDPGFLASVTTGNTARDMDVLRAAVGDQKLSYYGLSWGGVLGETYAGLFPGRVRAMALDSSGDADGWMNRPLQSNGEQYAGFEASMGRFLVNCAAHQDTCGFGGDDPEQAFDELTVRLDAAPLDLGDGIRLTGQDLTGAVATLLYSRSSWPTIAAALRDAQAGQVGLLRALADEALSKGNDLFFDAFRTFDFNERRYPRRLEPYLEAAEHAFTIAPHQAIGSYEDVGAAFWPLAPRGAFDGPFRLSPDGTPALVIHGTHDPASPYAWAKRVVRDLGNARLLTFHGDGHGVIPQFNGCVLGHLQAYLHDLVVPPAGASCRQASTATGARLRADSTAAWHIPRLSRLSWASH